MFETVVPETVRPRSRRLFYQLLPFSLALHGVAAGALVASSIWNVSFPTQSPRLYAAYQLIASPPPPPPPPPPPVRRPEIIPPKVTIHMPDVAPTVIPDLIPEVHEEVPVEIPVGDTGGTQGGVEGGIEGGELGGVLGGVPVEAPPPPKPPEPEVIVVKRDAPLPVGAISQEFPAYPEFALKRNWEDVLVVRYTIGKDGNVKDVAVIQPPDREEFTRAALDKIRHWRFHPYIGENGEPKEVTHEMTVEFKITRRGRS